MPRPNVPDRLITEVESLHEDRQGYPPGSFQEALATVIDMATPELAEEMGLLVTKAYPDDSGKNIVRLHQQTLQQLDIQPGAPVGLTGAETTVATAQELKKADLDPASIRMDGFVRQNAGVEVEDCVRVQRAEALQHLNHITFELSETAAEQLGTEATGLVHDQIEDRYVSTGDTVPVVADPERGGPALPLTVIDTDPQSPGIIHSGTTVNLTN